jgi:flagellar biosynthesis protein
MSEDSDLPPPYAPLKSSGRSVAVAIKGDQNTPNSLPKIVAAGYGKLAEKILALAFAKGVRVREDADLAELLAKLELDTPIPSEAIIAVAEILTRVYQANAHINQTLTEEGSP